MLSGFLKKQQDSAKQKKLIQTMIKSLNIHAETKEMYIAALDVIEKKELDELFNKLTIFVEKIEMKELKQMKEESFTTISGMRKKEAQEKMEEMNNLSFLFHNI